MSALEEILAKVDSLKKDLEDLGAFVYVNVTAVKPDTGPKTRVLLCLLVQEELKEDLEG